MPNYNLGLYGSPVPEIQEIHLNKPPKRYNIYKIVFIYARRT